MPRNLESFQRNPEEPFDKKEGKFKEMLKEESVERFNRTEQAVFFQIDHLIQDKKWDEAIAETLKIESEETRSHYLTYKIMRAQLAIGAFDGAKQLTGKLDDKISRVSSLRYIGSAQAERGLIDEAKETAEELKSESGKEDGYLAEVYKYIAIAEAERGQIESAKKYAALIEKINGHGEDSVYKAIVKAELNAGLLDDAKRTAKEIFGSKERNNIDFKIRDAEEKAKKLRRGPYR